MDYIIFGVAMARQFDKWVSKVVAVLKARGFIQTKKGATNHRKFVYEGKPLKQKCVINIQSKAKSRSRASILNGIVKQFKKCGAPKDWITEINTIALGMMTVQPSDTIAELEEKLYEALKENDTSLIVPISFEIGKRIEREGLANYYSSALSQLNIEQDIINQKKELIVKLEKILLKQFQMAVDCHITRYEYLALGKIGFNEPAEFQFDNDIIKAFEFHVNYYDSQYGADYTIHCDILGKTYSAIKKACSNNKVAISVYIVDDDEYNEYVGSRYFYKIKLYGLEYTATIEDIKEVIKKLEAFHLLLLLSVDKYKE